MSISLGFKGRAIDKIISIKESRISELSKAQRNQLNDVNSDDNDGADPIESTRIQMLDEVEQQTGLIDFLGKEVDLLKTIKLSNTDDSVTLGSLVKTDKYMFLVGVAQDEFDFEGEKVIGISAQSPLFKKMENLKSKAEFEVGKNKYVIVEVK